MYQRFWEIDAIRGTAVIMMIIYHFVFDLNFFNIYSINVISGIWRLFAYCTAFIFIFIAGISLSISLFRNFSERKRKSVYLKYIKRGIFIFFLGILITIVTWLLLREGYIIFGILHCIGISIIIAPLFFKYPKLGLLMAILCIITGFLISTIHGPIYLVWAGIHPIDFYSVDYFPLLPWFGVMLFGLTMGHYLYYNGQRGFSIKNISSPTIKFPFWLGRHSLIVYLVHQPIMVVILSIIFPYHVWVQFHFL